jgi:hypothetical protein
MKTLINIFFILMTTINIAFSQEEIPWNGPSVNFRHGKLKISENKRFLVFEDGSPFFYLGDTGWELFHRLDKNEAEMYLENRRAKGFTVIQAVVLAELDGLNTPNKEGEKPLIDNDPLKPNEKYFQHVDWVIKKAADKGLFIALLPTWGDKIELKSWGVGPIVFNKENAYKYGQWIASRYKDYPNIIWVNGGDRTGGQPNTEIWDALGKGIKSIDKNHLMTFHPVGGASSSEWFHDAEWLDFNMSQTGHCDRSYAQYKKIIVADYARTPVKPCFDGEPHYEDHPFCWNPDVLGWFDDADVRMAAYWNLFSGGHGHTYGCHPIWQFKSAKDEPIGYARHNWNEVIDLPGAWDMLHVRRLMESRPFLDRKPAQEIMDNGYIPENDYIVATKGTNYVFVYIPSGWGATIQLDKLDWKNSVAWWYNPKNGSVQKIEEFINQGKKTFKPEKDGRGNDMVLVIDNRYQ